MVNDEDIISGLKRDDRKAFEGVFEKFYKSLCAFSDRLINNSPEAEDIVITCFYELWKRRFSFDDMKSINKFLYTSVRNKCLSYLDRKEVIKRHTDFVLQQEQHYNIDHIQIEYELLQRMKEEINNLPEKCKKALILYRIKKLPIEKVASILKITERTVLNHCTIATNKLKYKLS